MESLNESSLDGYHDPSVHEQEENDKLPPVSVHSYYLFRGAQCNTSQSSGLFKTHACTAGAQMSRLEQKKILIHTVSLLLYYYDN